MSQVSPVKWAQTHSKVNVCASAETDNNDKNKPIKKGNRDFIFLA